MTGRVKHRKQSVLGAFTEMLGLAEPVPEAPVAAPSTRKGSVALGRKMFGQGGSEKMARKGSCLSLVGFLPGLATQASRRKMPVVGRKGSVAAGRKGSLSAKNVAMEQERRGSVPQAPLRSPASVTWI